MAPGAVSKTLDIWVVYISFVTEVYNPDENPISVFSEIPTALILTIHAQSV